MKVLLLSSYPPLIGGMESHVQSLVEYLSQNNCDVVVCTLGSGRLSASIDKENTKVYRMSGILYKVPFFKKVNKLYALPISDPIFIKKIENIIENEKPELIHAHGWMLYSAISLKKKYGIPLIATIHDYGYICPTKLLMRDNALCNRFNVTNCILCGLNKYGLIASSLRSFSIHSQINDLKYVDKFISVSSFVKSTHLKYIPDEKIDVIPNFYNFSENNSSYSSGIKLPDEFILFVGALAPHKGVDLLIKAFKLIENKNINLVICGKKHYSYEPEENIVIFENAPRELILEAYSKCKFVVVPSIWPEAFGIVAIESMSFKRAVIASDTGGLTDIVSDGHTGLLITRGNLEELVNAINLLVKNPSLAEEMGMAGYSKFMSKYTPKLVLSEILKLYQNTINFSYLHPKR